MTPKIYALWLTISDFECTVFAFSAFALFNYTMNKAKITIRKGVVQNL